MSEKEDHASATPADQPQEDGDAEGGEETPSEHEDALEAAATDLLDRICESDEDLADAVEDRLLALAEERDQFRERLDERETEVDDLESEIDDLTSRLKRTQADFQNYKRRAKKRQEQLEERATEDLVTRLVDVRDNLVRALEADHEDVTSIREGVELTLREFDRVLDDENVAEIDPEPGTDVDPQRHEVMMRVDSDQPADAVAEVYRPGYEMGGKVIRTAQVTVSEGANESDAEKVSDADDEDDTAEGSDEVDASGDDATDE